MRLIKRKTVLKKANGVLKAGDTIIQLDDILVYTKKQNSDGASIAVFQMCRTNSKTGEYDSFYFRGIGRGTHGDNEYYTHKEQEGCLKLALEDNDITQIESFKGLGVYLRKL
jgi:hypothetical protein